MIANRILYTLSDVVSEKSYSKEKLSESTLVDLCKKNVVVATLAKTNNIDEKKIQKNAIEYFYDYKTKELTCLESLYYLSEYEDEIIDLINESIIYKGE